MTKESILRWYCQTSGEDRTCNGTCKNQTCSDYVALSKMLDQLIDSAPDENNQCSKVAGWKKQAKGEK
jgi:hypothetical protein